MRVCKIRAKNVGQWIELTLKSLVQAFDKILVLNNHSKDNTIEICSSFNKVKLYHSPFEDKPDGLRDQNYLLQKALVFNPIWIMTIDGDEELSKHTIKTLPTIMDKTDDYNVVIFKFLYYWNRMNKIRVDGIYNNILIPRLFCTNGLKSKIYARDNLNKTGCHASTIPTNDFNRIDFKPKPPLTIKHYGYLTKEMRLSKYKYYQEVNLNNKFEDNYRHIVIGDILPKEIKTKHAGPLELIEVKDD